ncbi:MAG: LCP family protein [Solobacterium sp.]|nr:LCP family protein [Solobacterium sp.]
MGRKRIQDGDLKKAGIIVALLALVITAGFFIISNWENIRYATSGGEGNVDVEPVIRDLKRYTYKGKEYVENRNVKTYLIMGSDMYDDSEGSRADAQFLVVINDAAQTWRILMLDRDSMVEMETFNKDGKSLGTTTAQLTLAHLFGDWEFGTKNTVNTVSKLLWDQKIDGYFDMNMAAIPVLNDAVGGVPVKITTDFSAIDPTLVMGETITLKGKQAETFVRSRHGVDTGTNDDRMARQETYMKALVKKVNSLSSNEVLDIYDKLMSNSVTNMGSKDFADLAEKSGRYHQLDDLKIKGEHVVNNNFMEYHLDEDSLTEVILELFYS